MAQLPTGVRSAHVRAHPLNPRTERNAGKLAVMPPGHPIPHRDPDVLHNVVHVAGPADPREMRNHVPLYTVDGDHDLIYRNDNRGGLRRTAQGDVDTSYIWMILWGLIQPGFDSHGLHRFD
ncbi:hypothetical protein BJG92_03498 [Arthrobacter sp. SO5]|nr:hypothetical protein [Arthrobacter sp. SO5]